MIFTTPPRVPLPYRTVPPPFIISTLSTSLTDIVFKGIYAWEVSIVSIATSPSIRIFTEETALEIFALVPNPNLPCPLISTAEPNPVCVILTPGACFNISSTVLYPFSLISSDVIIVTFFIWLSTLSLNPVAVTTVFSSFPSYFPSAYNDKLAKIKLKIVIFFNINPILAWHQHFSATLSFLHFIIYYFFVY